MPENRFEQALKKIAHELGVMQFPEVGELDPDWAISEIRRQVQSRELGDSNSTPNQSACAKTEHVKLVVEKIGGLMQLARPLSPEHCIAAHSGIHFLLDELHPHLNRGNQRAPALGS